VHWRVAGASDAHAMNVVASALEAHGGVTSVVASALEAHGGVTMVAPLVPMVAPLVPCRALSLSHTQAWAAGGGSANERRERRRVVLHGWVRRLLSKSYRTRGCYVDLKPDSETPTRRRRRCAARAIPRARDESIAIGETRAGGTAGAGRGRGALPGAPHLPIWLRGCVRSAVLRAA
jgi:hypothetical protein